MYTHILIPTDGSELAGKAVRHGIALAKRLRAKVEHKHPLPGDHPHPDPPQQQARRALRSRGVRRVVFEALVSDAVTMPGGDNYSTQWLASF